MADPKQTDGQKKKPTWPIKDRARDMEQNTTYRGQGWSKQRTQEINNQGATNV